MRGWRWGGREHRPVLKGLLLGGGCKERGQQTDRGERGGPHKHRTMGASGAEMRRHFWWEAWYRRRGGIELDLGGRVGFGRAGKKIPDRKAQ